MADEHRQTAKIIGLIEDRSVDRLIRYALQTDYLLDNPALAYHLWDTFLPAYQRPQGQPLPISETCLVQMERDLERSFFHFTGKMYIFWINSNRCVDLDKERIPVLREKLAKLLSRFFEAPHYSGADGNTGELQYYQSFHDIASVLIIRFGFTESLRLLERLARSHLREFMDADFSGTKGLSAFVLRLLTFLDPEVAVRLQKIEMPPFFFVSWLLAAFTHDLESYQESARVLDVLVMLPPAAIGYVSALLIQASRDELLDFKYQLGDDQWGHLHQDLKELPKHKWNSKYLRQAAYLMEKYPPSIIIDGLPALRSTIFDCNLPVTALTPDYDYRAIGIGLPFLLAILILLAAFKLSTDKINYIPDK